MNNNFKREARYVVLKNADIMQCLTINELIELRRIQARVAEHRTAIGKPRLECVVVEKDWPEYEPTWKAIEARVTGAQPAPCVPDGVAEALQRLIENGAVLGPASSEDALLVARYRQRLLACAPSVPDGFSREDLEAVADGLDGYEKTVNVGDVTGGGDDHLESTTAYAARFIRAMFAAPETKP